MGIYRRRDAESVLKIMAGKEKKHCGWCPANKYLCQSDDVVATCDFRTLTRSKEAVIERLKQEKKFLDSLKNRKSLDNQALSALDRISGMKIMMDYLKDKHKMTQNQIMEIVGVTDIGWAEKMKLMMKVKAMKKTRGK